MSQFRLASLTRAAVVATVLLIPTVSAFADEQYYANITNPVPELSGQKIRPSDIHVVANVINPHPELMGQGDVAVATATQDQQSGQKK